MENQNNVLYFIIIIDNLYAPITLCILSENPFYSLFKKILYHIYDESIRESRLYKYDENNISCFVESINMI